MKTNNVLNSYNFSEKTFDEDGKKCIVCEVVT
jgi:hypothetical protein